MLKKIAKWFVLLVIPGACIMYWAYKLWRWGQTLFLKEVRRRAAHTGGVV